MVDLDSNPTKLIEIVEVGKQLLITRGVADHVLDRQRRRQVLRDPPRDLRHHLGGDARRPEPAARAQHHEPRHPPVRGHLGDHLQRDRDPAADPDRAARRALPADRRQRAAAAQPADLRARRDHRPVHRDQADRPARSTTSSGRDGPRLGRDRKRQHCRGAANRSRAPQGLPRHGGRRRQDLPDAPRGPGRGRERTRRGDRLPRAARPGRDHGAGRRARGGPPPAGPLPRLGARGDGPARSASPQARARTDRRSWRTPTRPGSSTRSATRTSTTYWRRASTCSRRSTCSTWRASTTRWPS